jgi:DNA-binding transcriptional LysR family regulator
MLRKAVDENLNQSNVVLVPQHEISNPALACQLVREGLGFTLIDPLWIDNEQRDKYCFIPLKPKNSMDFGIFTKNSSPSSKAVDNFINCLKDVSATTLSGFN